MNAHLPIDIGDRIRKLRKAKGMTQEALAKKAGKDQASISNIENINRLDSRIKTSQLETLSNIADALDMGLWLLLIPADSEEDYDALLSLIDAYQNAPPEKKSVIGYVAGIPARSNG